MRAVKLSLGIAALAGMVLGASIATAGAAPAGGTIHIYSHPTSPVKATITVTGAIGDYGTTLEVNKKGKVDPNGAFQKVTLKKGTFVADTTGLNKALNKAQPKANASNCSISFSGSGPATLGKGTGAYKGIGGTLKVTITFAGIAPRFTSGTKAGQCNFNGNPKGSYQSITGVGKIHF
jgi:hypothetical protein